MTQASPIGGSIDPQAFPFLLVDLHRSGATGSLKVEGPAYQKALYFRTGRILFGSSNDPRDQLGAILIGGGKISEEQFEQVSARVGPGSPLAKVLAESGFVSQRELGDAARAKVEQILADVIAWEQGRFEFEDGVLPKGAVDLKLSTEKLFLSAVRQVPDRAFVLRHLESLAVVLEPTDAFSAGTEEIQAEALGLPVQLDGRRSLKDAAALARVDEFEAGKIACGLLFLGLVRRQLAPEPGFAEPQIFVTEGASATLGQPDAAPFSFDDEEVPSQGGAEPTFFIDEGPSEAGPPEAFQTAAEPEEPFASPTAVIETGGSLLESVQQTAPFAFEQDRAEPERPFAPAPQQPGREPAPAEPFRFGTGPELGFDSAGASAPAFESDADADATLRKPKSALGAPAVRSAPPPAPEAAPPAPSPAEPTVPPRTASKADLEALDAFLNTRSAEGPLEPLEHRPAVSASPASMSYSRPARRRPERRVNPWLLGVAGALALVAVAVTAWIRLGTGVPEPLLRLAGLAAPTPTPTRPAPVVTPAPVAPTPVGAQTQPPPGATPEAIPPAPTPAVAPSTASPVAAAPTSAPTPAAATTPSRPPVAADDASTLLRQGDLAAAGQAFVARLSERRGAWSVQLLVACQADTVQKAVANAWAEALIVLPVAYKGRACHRMLWGVYDSEQEARGAVGTVPGYFVENGARPTPVATAKVLP